MPSSPTSIVWSPILISGAWALGTHIGFLEADCEAKGRRGDEDGHAVL